MKVPLIYRFIIKYVTPVFLLFVFIGSVFSPRNGDWRAAWHGLWSGQGWSLDNGSLIKMALNTGIHEEIASTADPTRLHFLQDSLFYINASRLLLVLVFVGIGVMVYLASKKRLRNGGAS